MTKVLLLRPEESRSKYNFKGVIENECLDLEWIYAILEKEYDVSIFDCMVEEIEFKDYIAKNDFDILYIDGRSFQESFMKEYARLFKEKMNGFVIIGGQHAQINYERFFCDYIDYILCGYNYYDLPKIIKGDLSDVPNLCFKKDNKWLINEFKATDISSLPLPNRNFFYSHPDNYQYLELKHALWIRSAFACPYKCEFCLRRHMNNKTYSRRSYLSLVDEIEMNDNEVVYIVDDDFLFDKKYVLDFINEIKRRSIKRKYICYGRSDFIAENEDIMEEFKKIGLYYVLVGLEDYRDDILNSYNKLNNNTNNEECIRICQKLDINLMAMFILALDYTKKDFNNLYSYIKKKNLKHVAVSIYTPELGLNKNVNYITSDTTNFDYLHLVVKPKYLSVKKYMAYYYILLIKLFLKGKRDGIYSFIDYGDYIWSFILNIFKLRKKNV